MSFWNNVQGALRQFWTQINSTIYNNTIGALTGTTAKGLYGFAKEYGGSYLDAATGAHLTGAQVEQNVFNADEAQKQRDWQAQMSNTEVQRRMSDMQAAGVNPMMAAGTSAGSPSGASASGSASAPSANLSDLFQLATLKPQIALMKAQANNLNASAQEKTTKSNLNEANTKLSEKQIEVYAQNIVESKKRCEKIDSDIVRNEAMNALSFAEAHLADVNAENIQALRDSQIALNEARALEAKADAAFAYANTLYQNGLIKAGMCEAVVSKVLAEKNLANAQQREAIAKAVETEIQNGKRTGSFSTAVDRIAREQGVESKSFGDSVIGAFTNLFDSIRIF